jgi:RNA polymerase sigma-70 factor (ECF subfamily)
VQPTAAVREQHDLAKIFADDRAFRTWYDATLPRVYGYLYHRCGRDPGLAEELTQQTFIEALRSHRRFDSRSEPTTWLIGIARHRLVDHYRRTERERRHLMDRELDLSGSADDAAWSGIERDAIDHALDRLAPLQRAALILHYMDRLSVRDIAHAIGKSEAATTSLLARGRDAFRTAFGEPDR